MSRPSSRTGGGSTERDRPTEAQVWVVMGADDVLAGHVYAHRRRGSESASFLYDEAYLARVDAYALDPALSLLSGLQQSPANQKVFGAFADSSPDRWGRNLISAPRHAGSPTRQPPHAASASSICCCGSRGCAAGQRCSTS